MSSFRQKQSSVVKTDREIELMKIAGGICASALREVLGNVKAGVSCEVLDKIAREEIEKRGATSSFMTVDDYKWTICTTINDQVVHGIPRGVLKDGDIVGIDIGACYEGFHSDMALTVTVGEVDGDIKKFLQVGENTLKKAISTARAGNHIGDISQTIERGICDAGYSVVKNLTGHGIGRELHEEPMVPGFGKADGGPKILENMVLAIEVIYTQGSGDVKLEKDNWTISSVDGSPGGLFEQTVAIGKSGPIVLTPYL